MKLKCIYTYPVKSLGGISLKTARVKERGLEYDRRWMLIDENNSFMTQREFPEMADLKCTIKSDALLITSKTDSEVRHFIPFEIKNDDRLKVKIWSSLTEASHVGKDHDSFFSEVLGHSCRLVFMDSKSKRNANKLVTGQPTQVGFADSYPYLIIGQASLEDLNRRLNQPVEMLRFRPNLVIEGCQPYEEDKMKEIRIGQIRFRIVKRCARCVLTTVDPQSYIKGKEPLATLSKYRNVGNQVLFGVNAIALDYGKIEVNDPVEKLE